MTDETADVKASEQKAAVNAMRGAQSAMSRVLTRVDQLERELTAAKHALANLKGYVGEHAHMFPTHGAMPIKVSAYISGRIAAIDEALT